MTRDFFTSAKQKALTGLFLLLGVVYAAGASVCMRGDSGACCEDPAALQCAPAAVEQAAIAPAQSIKDELSGGPDCRPDLPGVSDSVPMQSIAQSSRCDCQQPVIPNNESGQTLYLQTGRLRL